VTRLPGDHEPERGSALGLFSMDLAEHENLRLDQISHLLDLLQPV
jgi:hypothetical protein